MTVTYRCRYCKRETVITGRDDVLPRDRCPVGSVPTKAGSHLWRRVSQVTVTYRLGAFYDLPHAPIERVMP